MSFICHIQNHTEYNQQWNVFSAFNPSKRTHTWSSGQPTLRRPGSSWGFGALLKGLTSVVDNSCWSRDSNPQPRVTSPTLYPLEQWLPPQRHDCPLSATTALSAPRLPAQRHDCPLSSTTAPSEPRLPIHFKLTLIDQNIFCYR